MKLLRRDQQTKLNFIHNELQKLQRRSNTEHSFFNGQQALNPFLSNTPYFGNTSVFLSMSTKASRMVSNPTSTNFAFGFLEELANPATSWVLQQSSTSWDPSGFESKHKQAAWFARMCRLPCKKTMDQQQNQQATKRNHSIPVF